MRDAGAASTVEKVKAFQFADSILPFFAVDRVFHLISFDFKTPLSSMKLEGIQFRKTDFS